jgi:hypothetical protein
MCSTCCCTWSDLNAVTLRDIGEGLGRPDILAMGKRADAPGCLVEKCVNAALGQAFDDAEALLLRRFDDITQTQLSVEFHVRLGDRSETMTLENTHAA